MALDFNSPAAIKGRAELENKGRVDLNDKPYKENYNEVQPDPAVMTFDQFRNGDFGLGTAMNSLINMSGYGVTRLTADRMSDVKRSKVDKFANGEKIEELPLGPGYNYMTHLFKRHNLPQKIKAQQKNGKYGAKAKVFTDQMAAVKTALAQIGIASDKNPSGIPMDIDEAKQLWFGDEDIDTAKEAEWRTTIEIGDSKIDPKRVRKFVNYDGSLTWEILNEDKTVMSRFTLGDYEGTKIFAQGGYKKFAELLKKAREKIGPSMSGQFDAIRNMFGGE